MGTEKRQRQKAGHQARVAAAQRQQAANERRRRITMIGGLTAFALLAVGVLAFLSSRDSGTDTAAPGPTTSTTQAASPVPPPPAPGASIDGPTPCPATDGTAPRTTSFSEPPPLCIDPAKTYTATMQTSAGPIVARLDTTRTPQTTNNFVVLSRYGYYDGTAIFRADTSIDIVQGGAPTTNSASDPGPGYTIPDEGGRFTYQPGQLVMARTSAPNSASAQWFLTGGPKVAALDSSGTYVVFGTTDDAGTALVAQILATATGKNPVGGAYPTPPVIVQRVEITES